MGQKIHPLGFRVGITKRHQTVWFARFQKHQYAQTVLEDRFIHKTLEKLLPELLKKKYSNADETAKISQIKIERGFIPYEIGIQIHAQNCEAIKTAIDSLEVDANVFKNVLKNSFALDQASNDPTLLAVYGSNLSQNQRSMTEIGSAKTKPQSNLNPELRSQNSGWGTNRPANAAQRRTEKRFNKRKNSLERFRRRILENMLIVKKGKKITRQFQKPDLQINPLFTRSSGENSGMRRGRFGNSNATRLKGDGVRNLRDQQKTTGGDFSNLSPARLRSLLTDNRDQSQKTTKFMNVFLSKTNRQFLATLKMDLTEWNTYLENYKVEQIQRFGHLREAPLGYQFKWSLSRLKRYEKQPINILVKLLNILQKQALRKLEILRKEFFALGTISKMRSFAYFQRIRFIRALKTYIQQTKVEMIVKTKNKLGEMNGQISQDYSRIGKEKLLLGLTEKALKSKLTNLKNETRKFKLVEHLQSLIQRHRQRNLYLYLATISDSRKYLREIQKFTKQQANFLFGFTSETLAEADMLTQDENIKKDFVKSQLKKAIQKANLQNECQRSLQDVFLRQIQQQRLICQQNLALMPKISLKFYSVRPDVIETNASIVTDGIVDKLEKREAFRKVIKKVSEDLMKTNKVKGVKIQVSGRLNGAEIARSEWVRAGRVPLQTLRANIDYCYKTAQTIYGIIGVKVWIYRGYTKRSKNA
uniref:Small ribosomal subunit protein uS3c n=1 Tax=Raphidocelis subcapitata TaxID=307507 RepID=A0A2Z6FBK9_9CHLO|nr:30S ribosomal protein S3 [Raphidocelis subcapitata]